MRLSGAGNGTRTHSLSLTRRAHRHCAIPAYQGRVLIGSTRNPTSTDEAHSPRYRRCLYSLTIGVVLLEDHARHPRPSERVRHIRDCGFFSFPMSSYPFYTSRPFRSRWSRTTRISEPLVLGKDCYHLGLVDSHRKHELRATGGEMRSRSAFLCGLFQTG